MPGARHLIDGQRQTMRGMTPEVPFGGRYYGAVAASRWTQEHGYWAYLLRIRPSSLAKALKGLSYAFVPGP